MENNKILPQSYSLEEVSAVVRKIFSDCGMSELLEKGEQRDPNTIPGSYQVTFLRKKEKMGKTNRK